MYVAVTAVADISRPLGMAFLAACAGLALAVTPRALPVFARRLLPLASFGLLGFALVLLAPVAAGEPAYYVPFWGRPLSAHSVWFVGSLWAKSTLVVAWITALAQRLSERDLLEGLTGLHLPSKVTALCYLMVRDIHVVADEVHRLLRARDARGRPRGLRAVMVAGAIAQVLMVRLARRAETQALALVARGFDGRLGLLDARGITFPDLIILLALGTLFLWMTHL